MHEYDTALKLLLQRAECLIARDLGIAVKRWLNAELPQIRNPRVDLLAETMDGEIVHIEIQSANDALMPWRMLEYGVGIYRLYSRFPMQIVLYVGDATLNMGSRIELPPLIFQYLVIDTRDLDGDRLLESNAIEDNIIAVLARLRDRKEAVEQVVRRIASLQPGERGDTFRALLTIAGLRKLEELVGQEAMKMPVLNDILDHKVIGPAIRQGLEQGRKEGRQEGRQEGLQEGVEKGRQTEVLTVLRRVIEKRFGPVPAWVEERLTNQPVTKLEELTVQAIDAPNLKDLFSGGRK